MLVAATTTRALAKTPSPTGDDGALDGADFGLVPDSAADQSALLQKAVDAAAGRGVPLFLPGGSYRVGNIALSHGTTIAGTDGGAHLVAAGPAPIVHAEGQRDIALRGLDLDGSGGGPTDNRSGLIAFHACESVRLDGLNVHAGSSNGIYLDGCSGLVTGCSFASHAVAGIFANNSHELTLSQNRVTDCGNAGILVWQDASGPDGTIVTGNHILRIAARDGGNGQNGNGINIFRADNVLVADNVIDDCDFSAVRANTTRNVQIRGNTCTNIREVAIYSEFAFSGSVIANNVIDGAAAGISITNFKEGGQLAVCSGNIVRNITPNSPTNPDVTPYGIYAEAETAITGNTIARRARHWHRGRLWRLSQGRADRG